MIHVKHQPFYALLLLNIYLITLTGMSFNLKKKNKNIEIFILILN